MVGKQWDFDHNESKNANWTAGMRKIFEFRDLGIMLAANGNYVAHVIRANGETEQDQIHLFESYPRDPTYLKLS